jgi:SAM-dependent methyltransferase
MIRHLGDARLVGADVELRLLARGRRQASGPGLGLTAASVVELPFAAASFDAVVLSEVLEHLADDRRALGEAFRVLAPGGLLVVTVPHARYPFLWDPLNRTLEAVLGTAIRRGPLAGIWAGHVRLYTPEALRARIEAAGFTVDEERSFTHRCLPFTHNVLYGLGKPLLESGLPGTGWTRAADRGGFDRPEGSRWHPVRLARRLFDWLDRGNLPDEPPRRSTVNLAVKARKPTAPRERPAA